MREAQEMRPVRSHRRGSVAPCPWVCTNRAQSSLCAHLGRYKITRLRRWRSWYHRCSTYCAMRLIGVMLVCVGCHAEGTLQPDSAVVPDVPAPGLGMSVTWNARPGLPGSVTDKI